MISRSHRQSEIELLLMVAKLIFCFLSSSAEKLSIMVLDANSLDAIEQEVRNCFLFEDVPEYISALERDLQLLNSDDNTVDRAELYKSLMRTTHSLKGGAGIAQLPHLSSLAHKLEDLSIAIQQGKVVDLEVANGLLTYSFEHIGQLIGAAIRGGTQEEAKIAANMSIYQELDFILQEIALNNAQGAEAALEVSTPNLSFLKTVLEIDLEDCLARVEEVLNRSAKVRELEEALGQFIEECTLLGEAFAQSWLSDAVKPICSILQEPAETIVSIVNEIVRGIREQRNILLGSQTANVGAEFSSTDEIAASEEETSDIEFRDEIDTEEEQFSLLFSDSFTEETIETIGEETPEASNLPVLASQKAEIVSLGNNTPQTAEIIAKANTASNIPELKLRMPVSRLNRINNNLGELYINQERLTLFQQQLIQVNQSLKKRVEQFRPINEQIQTVYDRLATGNTSTQNTESTPQIPSGNATDEFDSLELDRYTDLHGSLQSLQELMVRVQESRSDIDTIANEFQSSLDDLRQQLNSLRSDLTESRFEPFRILSDRLAIPLPSLNQQYRKSVRLRVEGEYTPVDRLILEQLETPLTHIFRNAFDHGIETTEERSLLGKPSTAQITISAEIKSNQVVIKITDDGRGINLEKVYRKAAQLGLTEEDRSNLTREQLLNFMFMPGFSTANSITELSGRGVGLDIVRLQVERLQGSIRIETELGIGTQFILSIPLSLSILPLLLCRSQNRTFAFPSNEVIETIQIVPAETEGHIIWQDSSIPCYPLARTLPYNQGSTIGNTEPTIALIVKAGEKNIALGIDSLLADKELTVKPFDRTITVPSYLLGCTVLGTGEIVPVFNSDRLSTILPQSPLDSRPSSISREIDDTYILIVDDSIAVRRMLDKCLTQSGYRVVQCKDGKEAITVLTQGDRRFDLVISDIEMPRLDGFGLLQEIRSQKKWQDLPIAMLTSRDNEIHRQKASSLGATAYFTKPFQPQQIINKVVNLLANYSEK
jgi:chemotaxis protein histidine kinase CheA/CheY-like chemotaxis protein